MRYQAPTPDMSKILSLTSNNQLNSAKKKYKYSTKYIFGKCMAVFPRIYAK